VDSLQSNTATPPRKSPNRINNPTITVRAVSHLLALTLDQNLAQMDRDLLVAVLATGLSVADGCGALDFGLLVI
jgi:hypothetical protein